ncbi:MAG: glycoside hydrolase family 76 protein [Bacteroidota bacterium]|nr:glycoside hydrolase family 76 protein [Bacteroidota bacterium]
MTLKKIFFSLLVAMVCLHASGQTAKSEYQNRIDLINQNIYRYFHDQSTGLYYETNNHLLDQNKHSFLWPLCALVQAANEMERLEGSKTYLKPVLKAIDQYYNSNPPTPGYQSYVTKERTDTRYYDDDQWIGIACMDAYNRTGKKQYLDISRTIYKFMMTGYDTVSGGGIYWREKDKTTKNTCSNGPGILLALQLYNVTKQKSCLDTAILLYNWTNKWLLSPEGVYWDNIRLPGGKISRATFTYNTGTMLQANVLLYKATGNQKYLQEAQRLATAAERYFYKNNKLPGNYWFNAVLLRGYEELYKVEKNADRLKFFYADADRIWQQEKDENGLVGKEKSKKLIDQAAMIEIYARLEALRADKSKD